MSVQRIMTAAEIPLSRTKIVVPALRSEILHRPRLLALFDDLLDKKLIIVAAPAGYGKTSLLVDFARQSDAPVCWLSLDALDKDPQRFCAYLIAALTERFPAFGKQSNAVLRSLTNFGEDAERLLATLVNEIDSQVSEHFVLVVDDYQFVDAVAPIRDLFSRFVYLVGENCHVILASRRLPALPDITLMVARQQVGGFDLEQLSFRADEIRSLFKRIYGMTLEDGAVEELMQQTEGWITGLHLSADRLPRGVPDLTRAARAAGVDLDGYFDQQVLALQSPEMRAFLLQTSLLEEFDADLCAAVFGKGDWKGLLRDLKQNNLFVLAVGQGGKWLRYHPLFQEFLKKRFQEEEAEKAYAILSRLAEAYKERQEWEKAYGVYRQLGNPGLVADMIKQAGKPLLLSERLVTLDAWLEELPTGLLEARPALLSLKGALLCAQGKGNSALPLLDRVIPMMQKADDLPDLALALIRRAAAYRLVGDYTSSLHDVDEALRLSEGKPELQAVYAEAERFKGLSLYHLGRAKDSVQFYEDALHRYELLGDKLRASLVRLELGLTYHVSGDYSAASSVYERSLLESRREHNLYSQANTLNSLGVLYHLQGSYVQAVREFEAGLECASQIGSSWQEVIILSSLGDLYADLDEYESAGQAYAKAAGKLQQVNYQFLANYLNLAQARLARLRGYVKEAHLYLDRAKSLVDLSDSNYERGLFHLEQGCLRLIEKDMAASADLEQALDCFQRGDMVMETAWSRVWLAAAHLEAGKIAAGRAQLQTVFGAGQHNSLFYPLCQTVRQVRSRLAALQEDAEVGPALTSWLENVARAEAQLPAWRKRLRQSLVTVPLRAPLLSIQAFGKAQVRVNGRLVTAAQWKTASVRELFFYLLAASHPLTKEEIGEVLWPGMDTSQLKLRFKNDLYRLRHTLGKDVILFEDNRYYFNRLLDYEYDVDAFLDHLDKAKAAGQPEEKAVHTNALVGIRKGPYLYDVDATWVWPERERLDQMFSEALKRQVDFDHQRGNLREALRNCQEILKVDPCREDIHRLAMQLHAGQGDRLAVIWQYQACRGALRSELEVDPSEETENLYRRLTS